MEIKCGFSLEKYRIDQQNKKYTEINIAGIIIRPKVSIWVYERAEKLVCILFQKGVSLIPSNVTVANKIKTNIIVETWNLLELRKPQPGGLINTLLIEWFISKIDNLEKNLKI